MALIAILLAGNVLTTELYTSVWCDEVMYSQPAANQHFGMGFTSTSWAFQDKDAFWAGNAPMFSLLLCAWYKILGFGIYQTRALGYVIWALAMFFFCLAVRRFGWVTKPGTLSLLVALSFFGYGATFAYRSGRYEPLAVLLVSLCLLAFSIKELRWRCAAIFLTSVFFLPTCLTLGPFCVIVGGLLLLTTRWKFFRELIAAGTGLAVGLGLLYIFYNHFGVWGDFLRAIRGNSSGYYNGEVYQKIHIGFATILARKSRDILRVLVEDKSSVILMLATGVILMFRNKNAPVQHPRLLAFNVLAFVFIPVGLLLFYAFPIYYWWMRYLLLCVLFVALAETLQLRIGVPARNFLIAVVLFATLSFGLPGRLLIASLDLPERDYARVDRFVSDAIKPGDIVYADYQAFYPLEKLKVRTYYAWYLVHITPQEAASVNCLIVSPQWLEGAEKKLGGSWHDTGQKYLNEPHFGIRILDRLMPHYFSQQTNSKYNLAVYRRDDPTPKPSDEK